MRNLQDFNIEEKLIVEAKAKMIRKVYHILPTAAIPIIEALTSEGLTWNLPINREDMNKKFQKLSEARDELAHVIFASVGQKPWKFVPNDTKREADIKFMQATLSCLDKEQTLEDTTKMLTAAIADSVYYITFNLGWKGSRRMMDEMEAILLTSCKI